MLAQLSMSGQLRQLRRFCLSAAVSVAASAADAVSVFVPVVGSVIVRVPVSLSVSESWSSMSRSVTLFVVFGPVGHRALKGK